MIVEILLDEAGVMIGIARTGSVDRLTVAGVGRTGWWAFVWIFESQWKFATYGVDMLDSGKFWDGAGCCGCGRHSVDDAVGGFHLCA